MADYVGKQSRTHSASFEERAPDPLPGKHTLVEQAYAAIQRRAAADGAAHDDAEVHASAARGIATPGAPLPYADQIQRSFGRHDISSVQAHVGSEAAASASAMGADAYAAGNHVVLGKGTDLATVAHEAAHVVQQRGGVQLKGGVGAAGDAYEQHADAVAARVTAGQSAEALLDQHAGQGAGDGQIQRKTSIADTDPKATPGQGAGRLQSTDSAGKKTQHSVVFGALVNDCGSSMECLIDATEDLKGSIPSVRPSWWAAMMADPGTDAAWVSNNVVQGHLLNEHLGGPGSDMRNLTPFAKSTNSQHHAKVERAAKAIKARGNAIHYKVNVDYSAPPTAAWFDNKIGATYLAKFAKSITCVLTEYDAKTDRSIGDVVTTEVTNAIRGQG